MIELNIKEKFVELRAQGRSFDKIAKELNVSKQTLIDWSNEFQYEIANLKTMELEALQEQFLLSKKNKIKVFGELLQKIKNEITKRDLTKLPTDKLFDILLKISGVFKEEELKFTFKKRLYEGIDLTKEKEWVI